MDQHITRYNYEHISYMHEYQHNHSTHIFIMRNDIQK